MKNEQLLKLWPSYLASDCTTTGGTSMFEINESKYKVPRIQKRSKKKEKKKTELQLML